MAGPVIDLESTNAHVVVSDLWANSYGVAAGDGTPAVFAADSGTNAGNFVQVLGTPMLQGVAPLYLYNAGVNAGRLRMPSMNSVGKAVNEPRLYDNSAGNPVSVAAVGADPSIDLQLQAKSVTGSVKLQANGQTVLRADAASGGTDDVLFRSGAGTMNLVAEGGDPAIDYLLTPKGVSGGVRLQGNGLTTLRTDNPNAGDSALLVRPGTGAANLIVESASASADLVLAAKGPTGGVRLQAQGVTVVRLDNPGSPGTSDLLVRSGNQTIALTVEDPAANANLVLNPKGLGTVALGTSPSATDNSTNVVTSAWVVGQHFLTNAPVASVAGRIGAVTLGVADVPGAAPLASPVFSGTGSFMGNGNGSDPDPFVFRAVKVYGGGLAVLGGLKADALNINGTAPGGIGFARSGTYMLEASTTAATATRLTTDGLGPSAANCVNLPNASAYSATVDITGIDRTTAASAARYRVLDVMLLRGASAAATVIVNGVTAAAPNGSVGSGGTASFTAAADTANGCLALSVTPPNADAWHWSARIVTTEVQ